MIFLNIENYCFRVCYVHPLVLCPSSEQFLLSFKCVFTPFGNRFWKVEQILVETFHLAMRYNFMYGTSLVPAAVSYLIIGINSFLHVRPRQDSSVEFSRIYMISKCHFECNQKTSFFLFVPKLCSGSFLIEFKEHSEQREAQQKKE